MIDFSRYPIESLLGLSSPRLVVFESAVDHNIEAVRGSIEEVAVGSGFTHLMPHVKTHKSDWALRKMLDAGCQSFKCTLNEMDFVLKAGVRDLFVAYPLLEHDARRVAKLVSQAEESVSIAVQVGRVEHVDILTRVAAEAGVSFSVYLDLDVGTHRTGGKAEDVVRLAAQVEASEELQLLGLHAYDGHNHAADPNERRSIAQACMAATAETWRLIRATGTKADRIVVSGSPQFVEDFEELRALDIEGAQLFVSPGTFIYWDSNYERILPNRFQVAAFVLAQVMDFPGDDLLTLNVGHKRWSLDQGPVEAFSIPGLEYVSASEEHTVLKRSANAPQVKIGDYLLIAPKHVCPTVNLWGEFSLVDKEACVVDTPFPVSGRNF